MLAVPQQSREENGVNTDSNPGGPSLGTRVWYQDQGGPSIGALLQLLLLLLLLLLFSSLESENGVNCCYVVRTSLLYGSVLVGMLNL